MIIYVDVDGVCADIFQSLAYHLNLPYSELYANCEKGLYDQPYLPEVYDGCIWTKIMKEAPETFWSQAPNLPWYPALWNALEKYGYKVVYCTSVASSPAAASGRIKWLINRHGPKFDDFIITSRKELLAHSGAILIDDCDENLLKWEEAGGCPIRVPQKWNMGDEGELVNYRPDASYILNHVLEHVDKAIHAEKSR